MRNVASWTPTEHRRASYERALFVPPPSPSPSSVTAAADVAVPLVKGGHTHTNLEMHEFRARRVAVLPPFEIANHRRLPSSSSKCATTPTLRTLTRSPELLYIARWRAYRTSRSRRLCARCRGGLRSVDPAPRAFLQESACTRRRCGSRVESRSFAFCLPRLQTSSFGTSSPKISEFSVVVSSHLLSFGPLANCDDLPHCSRSHASCEEAPGTSHLERGRQHRYTVNLLDSFSESLALAKVPCKVRKMCAK